MWDVLEIFVTVLAAALAVASATLSPTLRRRNRQFRFKAIA